MTFPAKLSDIHYGQDYDIVVLGAGAAGMSAALFAAVAGLRPLLVESTAFVGGTTALSAGSAWVPNTQHADGADDGAEKAATYLRNAVGNGSSEAMRHAFLSAGPPAVAVLESQTDVHFRARRLHPDYETQLEGSTLRGRVLEAMPLDGRELGALLALVRPPIPEFTILGGLMVNQEDVGHLMRMHRSQASFHHAAGLVLSHLRDRLRYGRSMRLMMGNALVGRLLLSLRKQGIDLLTSTEVVGIEPTEAGARAVRLRAGATERRIVARHGVILATGGLGRNPAFRKQMFPDGVTGYCAGAPGHTGAVHDLVLPLGGRHGAGDRDHGFWTPMSVRGRADKTTAVFPHFLLDRGKPGVMAVDRDGRRFTNEAVSYHAFVRGMLGVPDVAKISPAFLITDERGLRRYGLGMVRPGRFGRAPFHRDGYLTTASTLDGLAVALGIDAAGLRDSVERMNRFAASGKDADFGRGETDYQRITAGDMDHRPSPCLGPIDRAPFHAIRLYPGDIGTSTGLVTDEDARILDAQDQPIPGLFACGNDMQSVMGGRYPGPGSTIGPALVFAYRAIRHIEAARSAAAV